MSANLEKCRCFHKVLDLEESDSIVITSICRKIRALKLDMIRRVASNSQFKKDIQKFLDHAKDLFSSDSLRAAYLKSGSVPTGHDCKQSLELISSIKNLGGSEIDSQISVAQDDGAVVVAQSSTEPTASTSGPICNQEANGTLSIRSEVRSETRESNDDKSDSDNDDTYEVDNIISVRGSVPNREFQVMWRGYPASKSTWEPELNLQGAFESVQKFLRSYPEQEKTILKGDKNMGAECDSLIRLNEYNWVSLKRVMDVIETYTQPKYKIINVLEFEGESTDDGDKIYLINYQRHCFVSLMLEEENICYIADGIDLFLNDQATNIEITNLLRVRKQDVSIFGLSYQKQSCVDYCASSAVLIALEFKRMYRSRTIPSVITASPWIRNTVTSLLHKHCSQRLTSWQPVDQIPIPSCPFCGRSFKGKKRTAISAHSRFCRASM